VRKCPKSCNDQQQLLGAPAPQQDVTSLFGESVRAIDPEFPDEISSGTFAKVLTETMPRLSLQDEARPHVPEVIAAFREAGATIMGLMTSPLTGADGNVEFLLHATASSLPTPSAEVDARVGAMIDAVVPPASVPPALPPGG